MYRILGGDGKQYGPVNADTLRQWIADGRANAQTQIFVEGSSAWVALGTLPEFAVAGAGPAFPPDFTSMADAGAARERALRLANPAGVALIVTGILGVLMSIGLLIWTIIFGVESNPFAERMLSGGEMSEAMRAGQKAGYFGALVVGIGWAAFIAFAGVKLRRLESWGLVLTGAILTLLPCCGTQFPLCLLSMPVGVWTLVVIFRADVKSQFS
jgi:hypothetical protein